MEVVRHSLYRVNMEESSEEKLPATSVVRSQTWCACKQTSELDMSNKEESAKIYVLKIESLLRCKLKLLLLNYYHYPVVKFME